MVTSNSVLEQLVFCSKDCFFFFFILPNLDSAFTVQHPQIYYLAKKQLYSVWFWFGFCLFFSFQTSMSFILTAGILDSSAMDHYWYQEEC